MEHLKRLYGNCVIAWHVRRQMNVIKLERNLTAWTPTVCVRVLSSHDSLEMIPAHIYKFNK